MIEKHEKIGHNDRLVFCSGRLNLRFFNLKYEYFNFKDTIAFIYHINTDGTRIDAMGIEIASMFGETL